MKWLFIFSAMLGSSAAWADSPPNDWPTDIVPTAAFLKIKAHPKTMRVIDESVDESRPVEQYTFYPTGLVRELIGHHSITVKLDRSGLVKEVIQASFETGNPGNAETFRPAKYDATHHLLMITSEDKESNAVSFRIAGTGVRVIAYDTNVRTEDQYYKNNGQISPLNRERFELNDAGEVIASCWGGEKGQPCDRKGAAIKEFGPDGIIRYRTGQAETIYRYENGLLVTATRREPLDSGQPKVIHYGSYIIDGCGNWIEREVTAPDFGQVKPYKEKREITYFERCTGGQS